MEVTLTCPNCGSAIHLTPELSLKNADCKICQHHVEVFFTPEHLEGKLGTCPMCQRKDFYRQKDFNRKLGVGLFVSAAILSIWTYGISLIVLYLFDLFLFKKLGYIAICYKCNAIFRNSQHGGELPDFNHEMKDRIVYSDHDFQGKPLSH
jgi:hypothetical protein